MLLALFLERVVDFFHALLKGSLIRSPKSAQKEVPRRSPAICVLPQIPRIVHEKEILPAHCRRYPSALRYSSIFPVTSASSRSTPESSCQVAVMSTRSISFFGATYMVTFRL